MLISPIKYDHDSLEQETAGAIEILKETVKPQDGCDSLAVKIGNFFGCEMRVEQPYCTSG